jgi:hypothetical protein
LRDQEGEHGLDLIAEFVEPFPVDIFGGGGTGSVLGLLLDAEVALPCLSLALVDDSEERLVQDAHSAGDHAYLPLPGCPVDRLLPSGGGNISFPSSRWTRHDCNGSGARWSLISSI